MSDDSDVIVPCDDDYCTGCEPGCTLELRANHVHKKIHEPVREDGTARWHCYCGTDGIDLITRYTGGKIKYDL